MSVDADVRVDDTAADGPLDGDLLLDDALESDSPASEPEPPSDDDSPRPTTRRRRALHTAWAPFIGMAVLLALISMFVSSDQAQWLAAAGGVLALVALGEAVWGERRDQRVLAQPLTLIGVGVAFVVLGEVLHAAGAGYLSYVDAMTLLGYPPMIAGLLRLTRARFRESALDTLLVAAIVPAALGVFAWLPLVEAIKRWVPGGSTQTWTAAAFLVVDVLAITIMARLAMFFRGKPIAYQLLLGAFTCLLGAHVSRTVGALTNMVPAPLGSQTLMLLSFGLVAAASLHPSMRRATRAGRARSVPLGFGQLALLVAAVLCGPAIVIWRFMEQGSWVIVAAAGPALVSLLVVAHLSRMIRERQRLEFATNHDTLTGLANRSHFYDQVVVALGRSEGTRLAVMFLDLDRFKKVNDSLGHDAGDQLLQAVAERLAGCARRSDTVARISGDEFAVLLPDPESADHATEVAARMLAQFERPFRIAGHSLFMTPSIGIALHPDHGDDVETLLRHADAAMYQAKAAGRKTIRVYDGAMGLSAQRQLAIETRLHRAIEDGELRLHYQPKVAVGSGEVLGLEALVRWQHPTHGLVPPRAFIRIAEESGLIAALGSAVLVDACTQMAAWHAAGYDDLHVSVNVSARQFALQDVPTAVREALDASGLPASALELELTESVGVDPDGTVRAALLELQEMGVRASIDDFGTGYSSISYLHDYPVDTLKLDRSFVQDITTGGDAPIVRAVIAMAHHLGIRVVAEGVETKKQLTFLEKHKCDEVQGFLISKPLPADDVVPFLQQRAAMTPAARRRTTGAVGAVAPAVVLDEATLGHLLWTESAQEADQDLLLFTDDELEDDEGQLRRVLVLAGIAGTMVVPVLLGLGAGGGLPPHVQHRVTGALTAVGAEAPLPAPDLPSAAPTPTTADAAADQGKAKKAKKPRRDGAERRTDGHDRVARMPRPVTSRPVAVSRPQAPTRPRTNRPRTTPPPTRAQTTPPPNRPGGGAGGGAGGNGAGGGGGSDTGSGSKPVKPGKAKKSSTGRTAKTTSSQTSAQSLSTDTSGTTSKQNGKSAGKKP